MHLVPFTDKKIFQVYTVEYFVIGQPIQMNPTLHSHHAVYLDITHIYPHTESSNS